MRTAARATAATLALILSLAFALPPAGADASPEAFGARVGGRRAPDGTEVQVDLPGSQHLRNKGGSDSPRGPGFGSGLCVFTSAEMASNWAGEEALKGFRDWMTRHPGGGWPQKLDAMIARLCQERGKPVPDYVQVTTLDLPLIRRALAGGHMVSITYTRSPTGRYGGMRVAHMVNLVHADDKWFAVLDNNHPGESQLEWMNEAEFRSACATPSCWFVVFLRQGPPPIPRNQGA